MCVCACVRVCVCVCLCVCHMFAGSYICKFVHECISPPPPSQDFRPSNTYPNLCTIGVGTFKVNSCKWIPFPFRIIICYLWLVIQLAIVCKENPFENKCTCSMPTIRMWSHVGRETGELQPTAGTPTLHGAGYASVF